MIQKFISLCVFTLLAFLFTMNVHSQNNNDTIVLTPIEVTAHQNAFIQTRNLDSLSSLQYSLTTITDKLGLYTSLFVKEYAPGGISTIAFRGTGAAHTVVLIDGFSVNPVMSGQADLSILPPFLFDKMTITSAPESILLHPAAMGGVISMQTNPQLSNKYILSLRTEAGSFGNYGAGLLFDKKTGKFLFRTRMYYHQAENDFTYLNNLVQGWPIENRIDAGFNKKGLLQEVFRLGKDNVVFVKILAQKHDNQMPASLLQLQLEGNETQLNGVFRFIAGFAKSKGNSYFSVKTYGASESWTYQNIGSKILSISEMYSASILGDYVLSLKKSNEIRLQWNSSVDKIQSNYYDGAKNTNNHRLTLRGSVNTSGVFLRPAVHLLLNDGNFDVAGVVLVNKKICDEKMNISISGGRNIRFPGMNDRYWNPGGNPFLQQETALSFNFNVEYQLSNSWSMHSGFASSAVDGWIVWQPTSVSVIWSPVNIRKVNSKAVDFVNVFHTQLFSVDVVSVTSYSYCISVDRSDKLAIEFNKQLIYVPMHMASHTLSMNYKKLSMRVESHYTGKRFTRADNFSYMPAHFHHNVLLSWKSNREKSIWECMVGLYNATGENYQIIAYQPMPRRYFKIAIQISLYEK